MEDIRYYHGSEIAAFVDWAQGLPSVLDTCYFYNRSAVDDLGDILEETQEERNKHTETDAEQCLTRLIYKVLIYIKRRKAGINGNTLRIWGIVFVVAGIIGRGVIQTHMMGMKGLASNELLNILETMPNAMTLTAVSIALQVAETCAVPIFSMLLIEGMQKTSDFKAYFKRVISLAVVSEIPFNLAMGSSVFYPIHQNVLWTFLIGIGMIRWNEKAEDALEHIAAKETMIKTGNSYAGVQFEKQDFITASGVANVDSLTVRSLPHPSVGVLYFGSVPVAINQTVSGENIENLKFIPAAETESASFHFSVNDGSTTK